MLVAISGIAWSCRAKLPRILLVAILAVCRLSFTRARCHPKPKTLDPSAIEQSLALGQELLRQKSFDTAAYVLEDILASVENHPSALVHLAEAYHSMGNTKQAIGLLERALGVNITKEAISFILNRRGIYLASMTDFVGARQSYEVALEAKANNHHASYNLALLLHHSIFPESSDFSILQDAIKLYRRALGRRVGVPLTGIWPSLNGTSSSPVPCGGGLDPEIHTDSTGGASLRMGASSPTTSGKSFSNLDYLKETRSIHRCLSTQSDHPDLNTETSMSSAENDEIGGPVNKLHVTRDLSMALLEVGRTKEAIDELENAIFCTWGLWTGGPSGEEVLTTNRDPTEMATSASETREKAMMWGSLSNARINAEDAHGAISAGKRHASCLCQGDFYRRDRDARNCRLYNEVALLSSSTFPLNNALL